MKIEANAARRLKQYFYYINWKNHPGNTVDEISEEILIALFRKLGCSEDATIYLVKYQEFEVAPTDDPTGSILVTLELTSGEDDFAFSYSYYRDISTYDENTEMSIEFNHLRRYKTFLYNKEKNDWVLYGYKKK